VSDYRTPEEERAQEEHEARIRAVLDRAVIDGGSLLAAMQLGEPAEVVEMWTNRLWNGLRDNLSDDRPGTETLLQEDRLAAIVLLLTDRIYAESESILRQVRQVAE
jgi:hypothetical protein